MRGKLGRIRGGCGVSESKGKEKSKVKGKIKDYRKDKRDILKFVPKIRKVKKDGK